MVKRLIVKFKLNIDANADELYFVNLGHEFSFMYYLNLQSLFFFKFEVYSTEYHSIYVYIHITAECCHTYL